MTASKPRKVLSVRLPEAELRRYKSVAASRGVSVQTAVQQAMEVWASSSPNTGEHSGESFWALEGSLADVDVFRLLRDEKAVEQRRERSRKVK